MARRRGRDVLASAKAQIARALHTLEAEIRKAEQGLRDMVAQANAWRALVGSAGRGRGGRRATVGGSKTRRVSWDAVLAYVPGKFSVADVLKHPGATAKGRAQVYPALKRWEDAKRIKRVAKGVYQKVSPAKPPKAKPAAKTRKARARQKARATTGQQAKPVATSGA